MDSNVTMVHQNNVVLVAEQAMAVSVTLKELRQRVWAWGKQNGCYCIRVEISDCALLITYYPSLSDGLVYVRVSVPASYQSRLPSGDW